MTFRGNKLLGTGATIVGLVLALQSWGILPYQVHAIENDITAFKNEVKITLRDIADERRTDRDLIISLQQQLVSTAKEIQTLRGDISELRSELLRSRTGRAGLP